MISSRKNEVKTEGQAIRRSNHRLFAESPKPNPQLILSAKPQRNNIHFKLIVNSSSAIKMRESNSHHYRNLSLLSSKPEI